MRDECILSRAIWDHVLDQTKHHFGRKLINGRKRKTSKTQIWIFYMRKHENIRLEFQVQGHSTVQYQWRKQSTKWPALRLISQLIHLTGFCGINHCLLLLVDKPIIFKQIWIWNVAAMAILCVICAGCERSCDPDCRFCDVSYQKQEWVSTLTYLHFSSNFRSR